MSQMTGNTNHISIITLNVNGLNSSIKRHRLADWIKKKDPTICCLQETHLIERDTHRLKVKGWGKTYHAHGLSKKAEVSILISDNVDFKPMLVRRDKEGHFILLKGSMHKSARYNNHKRLCPKQWLIHVHQTNPSQFQESNRPQHNNTRRF